MRWGIALLLLCCQASAQNIVTDGGFEVPGVPTGEDSLVADSHFGGWDSASDPSRPNAIVTSSYWQPAEGDQSFDLEHQLVQDVPAAYGKLYVLRFAMAGDPSVGPAVKSLTFEVGYTSPVPYTATFDTTGHSRSAMGWQYFSQAFLINEGLTAVAFFAQTPGVALDDVRLAPSFPGDADGDGTVGFNDLVTVARNYDKSGDWTHGDFNGDGFVAFDDLLIVARNYGNTAPATDTLIDIPEPNSRALLLAMAVVAVAAVYRRDRCERSGICA